MDSRRSLRIRDAATAAVAVAEWALLAWQNFHGGVPSHHFFDRADMPAISGWWGGLLLPAMTWFLVGRVLRRLALEEGAQTRYAIAGFASALLFGVLLSIFFTLGRDEISNAMFESMFLIAFLAPIYRAEYLLGLVLDMAYTFGGVLPCIVGSVLALIMMVIYRYVRAGLLRIGRMLVGAATRA